MAAAEPSSILVADNEPDTRRIVEGHLKAAGHRVLLADNGAMAFELFLQQQPDVVLLDILMPTLNGYDVCRKIRQQPQGEQAAVILFTALGGAASYSEAVACGADDILMKPINHAELLLRVSSLTRVRKLQQELQHHYSLIRAQRDALLTAQKQKEEISALLVHDLKNPLTAIIANAEFLISEVSSAEDTQEAVHDILGASESMHRMIMNLLDISRSENGVLKPHFDHFDVTHTVNRVARCLERPARARGQRFDIAFPEALPLVHADADMLARLLENLFENALRHSHRGSTVKIRAQLVETELEIGVSDEGPGIPEEYREHVFEKYVQLHQTTDVARRSRGLGLAFCKLAIEAHGGRIWVQANKPVGATFCFRLPLNGAA